MQTTITGIIHAVSHFFVRTTAAISVLFAVAGFLAPTAHAASATIYSNDFESYSTVATSDAEADAVRVRAFGGAGATAHLDGQGGFTLLEA